MKRHIEGILRLASFLSLVVAGTVTTKTSLMIMASVWIASSVVVIPFHFYKAWRRWTEVPNRRQYAVWVGFETLAAVVLLGLLVYTVASN